MKWYRKVNPVNLIQVHYQLSWMPLSTSNPYLANWFPEYAGKNYEMIGVVDYAPDGKLTSLWGDAVINSLRPGGEAILIFKRKPGIDGNKIQ